MVKVRFISLWCACGWSWWCVVGALRVVRCAWLGVLVPLSSIFLNLGTNRLFLDLVQDIFVE